jgi:signal transduction histidine kinase
MRISGKGATRMATSAVALRPSVTESHAPSPLLLGAIALAGVALAVIELTLAIPRDGSDIEIALLLWITVPYIAAGLIAWSRRPDSRLGKLMVAGGFAIGLSSLQMAEQQWVTTIGAVFDILPAAIFLHVYLAFPDGRLRSRFERALVIAAYVAAIGLQLLKMLIGAFPNHLVVTEQPDLAANVEKVQLLSLSAICLIGIGVLVARRRESGRPRRRSLALLIDSFALGLLMIAALFVAGAFQAPSEVFTPIRRATFAVIGIGPIVFLLGLLDARLARSAIGELVLELQRDPAPAELRDALARTLRDPTVTLAYWVPEYEAYVDLEGQPVELPPSGRGTTLIDRDGQHVAALVHDPTLDDEPELLDAVGAVAGFALENARLQAELAAGLEEVRGSRARVLEAGQAERKRLERDLHDGAQQRLVALSLQLKLLERQLADDPNAMERLDVAQREVALSLEELRDLARGIHPAVLSSHGLGVALEQVAARAPVPVQLNVDLQERLPEPVELAAYFVACEALANVGKYAQASAVRIVVVRRNGLAVIEIADDGVGGAEERSRGGLEGLRDRVEAIGGHFRVRSPASRGTAITAILPL